MKMPMLIIAAACLVVATHDGKLLYGQGKPQDKPSPREVGKTAARPNELLGTWVGVRSEYDGQDLRIEEVTTSKVLFGKDQLTMTVVTKDGLQKGSAPYRVNRNVKPYQIDVDADDKGVFHRTTRGIYRVERDRLTICVAVAENIRPTRFETHAGSKTWLSILRRSAR
jgi:uncharacterized protein (TIGR03067 family)